MASTILVTPVSSDNATVSLYEGSRQVGQLPDGTLVYVVANSAETSLSLYYATDHATPNLISTWSIYNSGSVQTVALAVDATGNLYVTYPGTSTAPYIKAFVKGTGYSWTPQTALNISGGYTFQFATTANCLIWCNTGGGTGGAGHLLFCGLASFGESAGVLDAGVALAGSGTVYTTAPTYGFYSGSASWLDASPDGFGATQGIGVVRETGSVSPQWGTWQVSNTGVLTLNTTPTGYALSSGFSTTFNAPVKCVSYGPGSQAWLIVGQSTTASQLVAVTVSMTGVTAGPTISANTGDWAVGGVGGGDWDIAIDPDAPNRVWVFAWSAITAGTMQKLGVTCSPLAWDATPSLADTNCGNPVNTSYTGGVDAVREPLGKIIDLMVGFSPNTGTTWQLAVDPLQIEGSANLPTLVSPANGTYEDVASGTFLSWTYNSADGASQAAFAIRYKIAGAGSYRYWNVALAASQSTPIWNTGTSQSYTLPSAALIDGSVYNWSVSTQSSTRIESGFAADNTLVAAKNPSVSVTAPTGTVTATSYPVVTWVDTLAPGLAQITYRVCVYTAAQAAIGGFIAGTSPSTWDSGTVVSTATAVTIPVDLPNATGYKAYVQIGQYGGEVSAFSPTTFAVSATLPATPTVTATATVDGNGTPCIQIVATDHEGSLSGVTTLTVARGDGTTVRTCPVTLTSAGQSVTVYDYEATPNAVQSYTASVTQTVSGNAITSLSSTAATATLTVATWWTLDPLNPTTTYSPLSVQQKSTSRQAQATVHTLLGAPGVVTYPVVISSGVNGKDGAITVQTQTKAEYDKIEALLQNQTTMWLASPLGDGMYVRYGPTGGTAGTGSTLHTSNLDVSPAASPVQSVDLTFVGQGRP